MPFIDSEPPKTETRPQSDVVLQNWPPYTAEQRTVYRATGGGLELRWCLVDARGQIIKICDDRIDAEARRDVGNKRSV